MTVSSVTATIRVWRSASKTSWVNKASLLPSKLARLSLTPSTPITGNVTARKPALITSLNLTTNPTPTNQRKKPITSLRGATTTTPKSSATTTTSNLPSPPHLPPLGTLPLLPTSSGRTASLPLRSGNGVSTTSCACSVVVPAIPSTTVLTASPLLPRRKRVLLKPRKKRRNLRIRKKCKQFSDLRTD